MPPTIRDPVKCMAAFALLKPVKPISIAFDAVFHSINCDLANLMTLSSDRQTIIRTVHFFTNRIQFPETIPRVLFILYQRDFLYIDWFCFVIIMFCMCFVYVFVILIVFMFSL